MQKRERIGAALRREPVDRVPLSLWRHYHRQDRTAEGLAEATLALAEKYDLDLVKLTPCGLYAVEDWVRATGGRIVYPGTDHDPPFLSTPAIVQAGDWAQLPALEPSAEALSRELEAIRLVAEGLAGGIPFMMTIFSPLTLAYKLAGEPVVAHLRKHPAQLHAGLKTIQETTLRFVRAALDAGADGLFFATQLATHRWLTPEEYDEFGARYDVESLEPVADDSFITVLHLHGRDVFFDLANDYPIHAVSWHDRETAPSLAEARGRTDRAFLTGLNRDLLGRGPEDAVKAHVHEALDQTEGRGMILAPSCVIPTTASPAHLKAVRQVLGNRD